MPDAGRVVTGSAKGMRLAAPGAGTRPLSDRLKQALFAMLEAEGVIGPEGTFLDLFAGSGAAGIEALSRGAAATVLVERDGRAADVLAANLRRSRLSGGRLVRADALDFLESPPPPGAPFSAAFLDPPYDRPLVEPALEQLGRLPGHWLRQDGVAVAKHFWRDAPAESIARLEAYRERRFGETMLTFYRFTDTTPPSPREDT